MVRRLDACAAGAVNPAMLDMRLALLVAVAVAHRTDAAVTSAYDDLADLAGYTPDDLVGSDAHEHATGICTAMGVGVPDEAADDLADVLSTLLLADADMRPEVRHALDHLLAVGKLAGLR